MRYSLCDLQTFLDLHSKSRSGSTRVGKPAIDSLESLLISDSENADSALHDMDSFIILEEEKNRLDKRLEKKIKPLRLVGVDEDVFTFSDNGESISLYNENKHGMLYSVYKLADGTLVELRAKNRCLSFFQHPSITKDSSSYMAKLHYYDVGNLSKWRETRQEHRRKGFGSLLFEMVEKQEQALGSKRISINVGWFLTMLLFLINRDYFIHEDSVPLLECYGGLSYVGKSGSCKNPYLPEIIQKALINGLFTLNSSEKHEFRKAVEYVEKPLARTWCFQKSHS